MLTLISAFQINRPSLQLVSLYYIHIGTSFILFSFCCFRSLLPIKSFICKFHAALQKNDLPIWETFETPIEILSKVKAVRREVNAWILKGSIYTSINSSIIGISILGISIIGESFLDSVIPIIEKPLYYYAMLVMPSIIHNIYPKL